MISLNKINTSLLYLMLFSPLLSYITFGLMGLNSITVYYTYFVVFYGIIYFIKRGKVIIIPNMLYFLLLYSIYLTIWSYYNGDIEERGVFQVLLNRRVTSIGFMILIIYNTEFTDKFISKSILIIKITIIFAAIVSMVQVVDYSFMDANPIWDIQNKDGDLLVGNLYGDRRQSLFGYLDRNELGLSYMPLLSAVIGVFLYMKYKYYLFFLLLGAFSAFLSNTRYIMVAFILLSFQIIFSNKMKITGLIKYMLSIFILGYVVFRLLLFYNFDLVEWYHVRLFAEGSIQESSRYQAFFNFLIFFNERMLFGFGGVTSKMTSISNAIGSSQIHVGYLAHLASYGLVGSFFLFGFWFMLAKKLYKTARLTNYWGAFFGFLVFLWANATLVYYLIFFYGIFYALVFDKWISDKHFENRLYDHRLSKSKEHTGMSLP